MRIAIGDDHPLFREGLERLFRNARPEIEVHHFGSYDEMLTALDEGRAVDLVLTDLNMPGWPGFEGIRALKDKGRGAPVVVVSASETTTDMRAAMAHGAAAYVPKSSSVQVMLGALELVLAGGAYVPPAAVIGAAGARERETGGARGALTQRQWDVLGCLRDGKSNKQIAKDLGLSEGTVKIHVTAIFKALNVRNRTQAVISAARMEASA
ncbi:response regulator transcription factor, partial [Arenibaculum sp.]|uniref:response regulator transcription factor n=1 Tax=Arenibaculum sp. TaxID=2865862 RepID=UPI002E13DD5A|nr:response regulator transcription factor [Arenibaculum sp.]